MDKLESIQAFVAVAQAGGFSAASRALGVPLPTVSRKVGELETSLGVRLFDRSTRRVLLTAAGRPYFESCRRILDDLRDADEAVAGEHRTPRGELTVTAPVGFGHRHLQPVVEDFMRAFPDVDVRLLLADRIVDLLDERVDVALRISQLPDSRLVARPLGQIRMLVVASPAYLAAAGEPTGPRDLAAHACILWASLGAQRAWQLRVHGQDETVPIHVRMTTTLPDSAVAAAVAGFGLAQVTSYQAEAGLRSGELVTVLRDFEPAPTPVSLVHAARRRAPQKVRAFLDHAAPRLAERLAGIEQALAGEPVTAP